MKWKKRSGGCGKERQASEDRKVTGRKKGKSRKLMKGKGEKEDERGR